MTSAAGFSAAVARPSRVPAMLRQATWLGGLAAAVGLSAVNPALAQTAPDCSDVFPQAFTQNAPAANQLALPAFPGGTTAFTGGNLTLPNATYCSNGTDCYFTSITGTVTVTINSPVRIFVGGELNLDNGSSFNAGGDPADALVFVYGNARLGNDTEFNGILYSLGSVQMQPRSSLEGAITALGTVGFAGGGPNVPTVTYDANAVDTADFDGLCINDATVAIDHYRLIHPVDGLTCQASSVTLRVCANDDCSDVFADTADVVLSPSAIWQGGNVRSVIGGEQDLLFRSTTAGTATLGIASADPAAPLRCYNPGEVTQTACEIAFADSGFILRRPDGTIRPAGAAAANVPAVLQAVRTSDPSEACVADLGFADETRTLQFDFDYQNPVTGTRTPSINGNALPEAISLTFDGNAVAPIDILYGDAGVIELDAVYTGSVGTGDDGLIMPLVGERGVAFRPQRLLVTAERLDGTPLDNAGAGGDPHHPAGAAMRMVIEAQDGGGNALPNFRHNPVALDSRFFEPAADASFEDGALAVAGFDMDAGIFEIDNQTISEVGVFEFRAQATEYLPDYFAPDAIVPVYTGPVGRFTPHHLAVIGSSIVNRRDAACTPSSDFTYMDEPLDLLLDLEARNLSGARVQNYRAPFSTIPSLSLVAVNDPDGTRTDLTGRLAITANSGDWAFGQAALELTLVLERDPATADGPYPALTPGVVPTDGDDITVLPAAFDLDGSGDGTDDHVALAATEVMFGRLALGNAHGSELVDLALPVRAEYFSGAGFVVNVRDSCTALAWDGELLEGETVLDGGGSLPAPTLQGLTADDRLDQGQGSLVYACGSATCGTGYTRVCGDLAADLPWLQFAWNPQDAVCGAQLGATNPTGRATFGVYTGSERIIYLRERMN
ncbi:MAG: DUF6701 domain-containing protein [Aquisalimonadaceae bacterium]